MSDSTALISQVAAMAADQAARFAALATLPASQRPDPGAALAAATADAAPASAPAQPAGPATAAVSAAIEAGPTYAGDRRRARSVALEWPLLYQGQLFDTIVVARPTTQQVADYYDRLIALPEGDGVRGLRFPIFFDAAGAPVPDVVMDALDADDADLLQTDITDFLPRRLRMLQASDPASTPAAGADTGPTSGA